MGCLKLKYYEPEEAPEVIANFFGNALEKNDSESIFCLNAYTYGFNGMERVDEVSGSGNHYTTAYRPYDARLGRWTKLDPIFHPWQSSYSAFNNNPIYFVDPDGRKGIGSWLKRAWHKTKEFIKHPFNKSKRAKYLNSKPSNNLNNSKPVSTSITADASGTKVSFDNPVEITAERTKREPLKPQGYYILTRPDAKNVMPIAEPWVTDPNILPDGYLNIEALDATTALAARDLNLPSFENTHWELFPDVLGNILEALGIWPGFRNGPLTKTTTNKDVQRQVEKTTKDNMDLPDTILISKDQFNPYSMIYQRSDGKVDTTDERNDVWFKMQKRADSNLIIKDLR